MAHSQTSRSASPERRQCKGKGCRVILALDQTEDLCSPCRKKGINRFFKWAAKAGQQVGSNDGAGTPSEPATCSSQVMELASFLLEEPSRWGLMGIEFTFFHRFYNDRLQAELKEMRQQLYGREDPPTPMTPRKAEEVLGHLVEPTASQIEELAVSKRALGARLVNALAAESGDLNIELIRIAAGGDRRKLARLKDDLTVRLKQAVKDLAYVDAVVEQRIDCIPRVFEELEARGLYDSPGADLNLGSRLLIIAAPIEQQQAAGVSEVFWQVARRLAQREAELSLLPGSLYAALVCGTTPIPESISFSANIAEADFCIRMYSAKAIESFVDLYRAKLKELKVLHPSLRLLRYFKNLPEPEVAWIAEGSVPYLRIRVNTEHGLPSAWHLERLLRRESRWKPFYDRGTRVKEIGKRIRTWAVATLKLKCDMQGRDALEFWDKRCDDPSLRYGFRRPKSGAASQEVQLHQDTDHVLRRLAQIEAAVPA